MSLIYYICVYIYIMVWTLNLTCLIASKCQTSNKKSSAKCLKKVDVEFNLTDTSLVLQLITIKNK